MTSPQTLVPKIRFEGFSSAWERHKLGEFCEITTGRLDANAMVPDGKYDFYTSGIAKYKIDIPAFSGPAITLAGNGATVGYMHLADGLFNAYQRTYVLSGFGADRQYLFYAIGTKLPEKIAQEARTGNIPYIVMDMLTNLDIDIPSMEEQALIGECLKKIGSLIVLHRRKQNQLKCIKKSMIEKMFPRDGANVPEIRFAGFTNAWEQRKFSDLVLIERGGSPRPIDDYITDAPDGLNWVKIGDAPEQGRYITKTAEKIKPEGLAKTRQVQPGDLILSNSMSFGKPYIMGINGCIHDGWLLIRDTQSRFDLKFLCHMLGTDQMLDQYRMFAAGSTVNNLNKELVGNTTVSLPSIEEQRAIGEYLESIDNLITLHQRKYEKLKQIKKSMLEKMFV